MRHDEYAAKALDKYAATKKECDGIFARRRSSREEHNDSNPYEKLTAYCRDFRSDFLEHFKDERVTGCCWQELVLQFSFVASSKLLRSLRATANDCLFF